MSKDRIYTDKASEQDINTRDLVAKNLNELEQRQQLRVDYNDKEPVKELTRMQRKFNRIFGFSKMTSQMFMNGFMMGGMVGGAFGGMIGTYFAI